MAPSDRYESGTILRHDENGRYGRVLEYEAENMIRVDILEWSHGEWVAVGEDIWHPDFVEECE